MGGAHASHTPLLLVVAPSDGLPQLRLRPPPVLAQPRRWFARRPGLSNLRESSSDGSRLSHASLRVGDGGRRGGCWSGRKAGAHQMRAHHQTTARSWRSPSSPADNSPPRGDASRSPFAALRARSRLALAMGTGGIGLVG
jgi:hypothetical protein